MGVLLAGAMEGALVGAVIGGLVGVAIHLFKRFSKGSDNDARGPDDRA